MSAQPAPEPPIETLAGTFAMEYLTGHYRPLRDDERWSFDQLKVVMLAFSAAVHRAMRAEVATLRHAVMRCESENAAHCDEDRSCGETITQLRKDRTEVATLREQRDMILAGLEKAEARLAAQAEALETLEQRIRSWLANDDPDAIDLCHDVTDQLAAQAKAIQQERVKGERVFEAVVYAFEGKTVPDDLHEHGMVRRALKFRAAQAEALETLKQQWLDDATQEGLDKAPGWVGAQAKLLSCVEELAALRTNAEVK